MTASSAPAGGTDRGWPVELDLLELWVSHLAHTQRLLTAFGFQPGDPSVHRDLDEQAVYLGNGEVGIVVRQGGTAASPVARHVALHGDTIADVALVSADPAAIADRARAHGLRVSDCAGTPTIDVFGDGTVCHTLRRTRLVPGQVPSGAGPEIRGIDHVAYCLPWRSAEPAARAYEAVLGLERIEVGDAEEVGGQTDGMRSIALRSAGGFTVVLTEPMSPASTGQTQRFLDAHAGPGVQHAALTYDDVGAAVESVRARGVRLLPIPDDYYVQARRRLAHLPIPWDELQRRGILVDADERGLLFQLFTAPLTARGTFFAELIQRAGAVGFGANNVRALFAALHAAMGNVAAPTSAAEASR